MLKNPIGSKTVTVPVSGGNFSIAPSDLSGGSHFLVYAGAAFNGGQKQVFFGDHLIRTAWTDLTGPEQLAATLDLFKAHPAGAIDEFILMQPQAQYDAGLISGFAFPMSSISLNIICYG